jgi:hypothetical protein
MDQSITVVNWTVFIVLVPTIVFVAMGMQGNKRKGKNIFSDLGVVAMMLGAIVILVIAVNIDRGVGWFSWMMLLVSWIMFAFVLRKWWSLWKQRSHG